MLAKLVHARIDPALVPVAARAVEQELAPAFVAHPGARLGCWMANRTNGHVLAMTVWSDESSLHAEQAADGAERAQVAERIGLELHAIEVLEVIAVHDLEHVDHTAHDDADDEVAGLANRWARVTWVEGLSPSALDRVDELHAEITPSQTRSDGFCASYWLADRWTGDGLALSTWASATQLRDGEPDSRRRRRIVERTLGCHVAMVGEYEALGVTLRPEPEPEQQLHLFDLVGAGSGRRDHASDRITV
jgi:hypothetical protein